MEKIRPILDSPHFKYGLPFMITVVGGSFCLKWYSQLRYEVQKEKRTITRTKEIQKLIGQTEPITIEDFYEEYKKKVDIDNWKNIRGPRPWETDNMEYKQLIEKRLEDSKNQWVFKKEVSGK